MRRHVKKDEIFIVISKTPTRMGKIIRKALGQEYNHVSLSLDRNLKHMYSFGRIMQKNPLIGGLIQETRRSLALGSNRQVYVRIYRIPVTEVQYNLIWERIRTLYNDEEGYFYNYLGAIGLALNIEMKMYKTYICSEFALEMLKYAGIEITTKESGLVTPEEIGKLIHDYLIFEGDLAYYGEISELEKKREAAPVFISNKRQRAARNFLEKESRGVLRDTPLILRFYAKLIRRQAHHWVNR